MIDSVPLIQNANDAQQINASIIALKKASRELDEKIAQFNKLLSQEITNREKAITEAINSLDVPSVGGSGKYISAISETDGKISATESDITSTVSSGNSQPVTSGGVAETLNNPMIKTFSNNVSSNKIIHLGHFTVPSSYINRCGLNIEVEAKRADGSYRMIGSIDGQTLRVGVFDVSSSYLNVYYYKTDNNNYDLYLFIGSYVVAVFVKMTEPQYFTYDGSVVSSYAGTQINPIYSNSTDSVTNGSLRPVTSGAAYNAIYGLQRLKNLFVLSNNSGSAKYYKITGITSTAQEYVFLLQAREGELSVISCGFGDNNTYKSPKIKRLLNTYSKILGFTFKDAELYMCVATWSHSVILTQICGTNSANVSISETTQEVYNSGTPITIET